MAWLRCLRERCAGVALLSLLLISTLQHQHFLPTLGYTHSAWPSVVSFVLGTVDAPIVVAFVVFSAHAVADIVVLFPVVGVGLAIAVAIYLVGIPNF